MSTAPGSKSGSRHVVQHVADRRIDPRPPTGVDQHQLRAGVDHLRIVGADNHVLRKVRGRGSGDDLILADIGHVVGGDGIGEGAIVQRGAFEATDLVAVEPGRLLAGDRRGGARRQRPQQRSERACGNAADERAAGGVHHGVFPLGQVGQSLPSGEARSSAGIRFATGLRHDLSQRAHGDKVAALRLGDEHAHGGVMILADRHRPGG